MKKIFYTFSALVICMSLLLGSVSAAEIAVGPEPRESTAAVDVWDGITMTEPTETVEIDGKTYYRVTSCAELAYLATADMWSLTCENISLEADLVLNTTLPEYGEDGTCSNTNALNAFTPFKRFTGDFRGNGHTISGLYVNSTEYDTAFFRELMGTVSDLHFTDSCIIGAVYAAGICSGISAYPQADYSQTPTKYTATVSSLQNCSFRGAVFGSTGCGGLVGKVWVNGEEDYTNPESFPTVSIKECVFEGRVNGSGSYTGGIVGTIDGKWGTVNVIRCENLGTIQGESYAGGINGYANNVADCTVNITNSVNRGDVKAQYCGGGISGAWTGVGSTTCSGCVNLGKIESENIGSGLIGNISTRNNYGNNSYYQDKNVSPGKYLIRSCCSVGEVYSSRNMSGGLIAGIAIQDEGIVTAQDLFFCGNINTADSGINTGALFGDVGIYGEGSFTAKNCYAAGSVLGKNVGSLMGKLWDSSDGADAAISFSGCKWLKSMASALCVQKNMEFDADGCAALSADEFARQTSFPEFDFDSVWKLDAASGYPFPQLKEISADIPLQSYFTSVAAHVAISEVGKTVVRANLNLLCDSQVIVAVYRENGQMVDLIAKELSAGTYQQYDFALRHTLSVGDRVQIFAFSDSFCLLGNTADLTVEQEPPEKLYSVYLELDEFQHLHARINSPLVSSMNNRVYVQYFFADGGSSGSGNGCNAPGDVGYDLTNEFAYCYPCQIRSITLTHYVNNEEVATATMDVSISAVEGSGTAFNITDVQAQIVNDGWEYIRYEFTVDQPLREDTSYVIKYQNETTFSHSNKIGTAWVENGKLVCYKEKDHTFPGTGHFWATCAEEITMNEDGSAVIVYQPTGVGYRFNNDTLTAE